MHLVPQDFYKKEFFKELCEKSFENILHQIIRNSAYMQKRIAYASIKTLQIELLLSSTAKSFTLSSISLIKYTPLESEVSAAIKCSVSLPDN